ncbi:MAG: hypothetical protein IJ423_00465 [Clostridia bacterium]|nr:hypothetical protein [Clostridia bacterium]
MTNSKLTKRSLLTSSISLLLCFAMLLGTTFAWFTDSVTSANNIIKSGNLDIKFEYWKGNGWADVKGASDILTNQLWEPGVTEVAYLKVSNAGSLALKYQLGVNIVSETAGINVAGDEFKLSDYIYFDVVEGKNPENGTYTRETVKDVTTETRKISTGYSKVATMEKGVEPHYLALVVHMPETVTNKANHNGEKVPQIDLGINVVATQFTNEEDSFGSDYDEDATYPAVNSVTVSEGSTTPSKLTAGEVTVYIPEEAGAGKYRLEVMNKFITTNADKTTVSYDINLYKDDAKVRGVLYDVEIEIGAFVDVTGLTHNGNAIDTYTYNTQTGIISFKTDSFSPFAITYKSLLGEDAVVSDGKIIGGNCDVNPATLDPSLAETDSEYIAINYTKDGKNKFLVTKRANSVVLAAPDTIYEPSNKNYTVTKLADNGLYAQLTKGYNNVYLLPGTYSGATTLTVSSSMNIEGLGDAEKIKVIKKGAHSTTTTKPSNRHLFNCTNASATNPYIEVTIRNLYLDATEKNSYQKKFGSSTFTAYDDNAAVQSIRRAKVKCYDLIVVKDDDDMSSKAFYCNANQKIDGKYYPAYMYVENSVINSKYENSIADATGTGKAYFYYSDLSYANGDAKYAKTSTYIKNFTMSDDNWEW